MESEDTENQTLEGIGDAYARDVFTQAEFPPLTERLEPAERAEQVLIEADKFVEGPAAQSTKAGLVDALSLTIDALQEVFAELEEAKTETLAVAKRATEKATRAGVELDLSLLDDPFDAALSDVNRLLNTLEKQRNRARMAAG